MLGERPNGELFDELISGAQCFREIQKMHQKLIEKGYDFKIVGRMDSVIDKSLLNAIAHNDFFLEGASRKVYIQRCW